MKDEEILKILKRFSDILEVSNILMDVLRWIGWALVVGLSWLVDSLEGITDSVLTLSGFFKYKEITDFLTTIKPGLYILFALSICFIGYQLMFNRKGNRDQIVPAIVIGLITAALLGTAMSKTNSFIQKGVEVAKYEETGSTANKVIKKNLTDVSLYDNNGWTSTKLKKENNIPKKYAKDIDINERLDGDFQMNGDEKISKKGIKVLEKKMAFDSQGNQRIQELDSGVMGFFSEKYYRWKWDFLNTAITLLVTAATLLFVSIKLARLAFELAFNHILASILAHADIASGGQKLKEVLKHIFNTFAVIVFIFISLRLYLNYSDYISSRLDGVAFLIALIAGSLAVIDGPVMCERVLGIDAGLKSGWGTLVGGLAMAKGASNLTKKGASISKKGASMLATGGLQTAAVTGGAIAGLKGQKNGPSLEEEMKKNNKGKQPAKDNLSNSADTQPSLQSQMQPGKDKEGDKAARTNADTQPSLQSQMPSGQRQEGDKAAGTNADKKPSLQSQMPSGQRQEGDKAAGTNADKKPSLQSQMPSGQRQEGSEAAGTNADETPSLQSQMPSGQRQEGSEAAGTNADATPSLQSQMPSGQRQEGSEAAGTNADATPSLQSQMPSAYSGENQIHSNSYSQPPTIQSDGGSISAGSTPKTNSSVTNHQVNSISTADIPLTNQNRNETRTLGQYFKESIKNKADKNPKIQNAKRTYQLTKNTVQSLRNKNK